MGDPAFRLEDLQWLRALAARLVRDPHAADDAVQSTLVAALERGPAEATDLRAWLAAVLRNVLRQDWRARARRSAREAAHAPPRAEPSTLEVVEELALHRRLADEVHALAEPYRTAILLRYLRARSTEEIARELGVPVKTVRTRLERGVAKLRERLGRDREAWALLLAGSQLGVPAVPARRAPLAAGQALGPALLVSMKAKLVGSVVALSLLGAYLVLRDAPRTPAEAGRVAAGAPPSPAPAAEPASAPDEPRERSGGARTAAEPAPDPRSPAPAGLRLGGFVRTLDGAGLAGVEVVLEQENGERFEATSASPRVRSTAGGRFELTLTEPRGRLNVDDAELAAVVTPHLGGALPPAEPILVVAASRNYAGKVVDPTGLPIPAARLEITLDGPIVQSRDVGGTPVHLLLPFAETTGDAGGAFRFERTAFVAGAVLEARADGFDVRRVELPSQSAERLELVLQPSTTERLVHGVVLEPSGVPAAGAQVSLGTETASADAAGTFVIACEAWRKAGWLRAVQKGHLPAEVALAEALASTAERPVVLTLGGAPLAIRGRVLDASGAPVAGAAVFTPDTTPFGSVEFEESAHAIQGLTTVEAFLAGVTQHPWESLPHAETAADGSFVLEGLLDRSYALFALDARTLASAGPVLAGPGESQAVLRLPPDEGVPVAGRVVSRSGQPLGNVSVRLGRSLDWSGDEERGSRWAGFPLRPPPASWLMPVRAKTDAEGRFELGTLVPRGAYLVLSGELLALGGYFELDGATAGGADPAALEVVVEAASRFQVVPRAADGADAFGLEQLDGEDVVLFLEVEGLTITALHATIEAGRSGVVLAREGEYDLVLYAGEEEVRRERVRLAPGGVHELTP